MTFDHNLAQVSSTNQFDRVHHQTSTSANANINQKIAEHLREGKISSKAQVFLTKGNLEGLAQRICSHRYLNWYEKTLV